MSVLVTMRVAGDVNEVEKTDREVLQGIVGQAKEHGILSHHFYGNDKEILVVDEWPDEQSFQTFFESTPEIKDMMERAHAGKPQISFWRHLDVDDDIG